MFGLYCGILGLLLFKISMDTIQARRRNKVSLGNGGSEELEAYISTHSNFVLYVPIFLILIYNLNTFNSFPKFLFHILCIVFIIGRILHYVSFTKGKMDFKNRIRSMKMTLFPLVICSVANIVYTLYEFFKG